MSAKSIVSKTTHRLTSIQDAIIWRPDESLKKQLVVHCHASPSRFCQEGSGKGRSDAVQKKDRKMAYSNFRL
jgi:hypothetical protein